MRKTFSKNTISMSKENEGLLKITLHELEGNQLKKQDILQKLMRPVSVHAQKHLGLNKKYQPKFEKPDQQTLLQQNLALKHQINTDKQIIMGMKFKLGEYEKKMKSLQSAMDKYQKCINNQSQKDDSKKVMSEDLAQKDQIMSQKQVKQLKIEHLRHSSKKNLKKIDLKTDKSDSTKIGTEEGFKKNIKSETVVLPVYTQILKKKIQELNSQCANSQSQIRQLKKLPNASIFDENSIEKQHLLSETIRLKAIITSLSEKEDHSNDQFQNQFLKLMKEENQKLKATIRLLENDKNLLKSRQSIQKKLSNDLKKEIEHLKQKMMSKQAEIEKLNNENKNLLFKKVNQFRIQQQKKQSEELSLMKKKIQNLQKQNIRIQYQKDQYSIQNHNLKEKDKQKDVTFSQNIQKLMKEKKASDQKAKDLESDIKKLLQDYNYMVNNSTQKKKKERTQINKIQKIQINKPVKLEDIQLSLLSINYLIQRNKFRLQQIFEDNIELKCTELIGIFMDEPLKLDKKQATKLARYMVEVNNRQKILYDENAISTKQIGLNILRSSINLLKRSQSSQNQDVWRCILAKSKKIVNELETIKGEIVTKQKFIEVLSRNISERIEAEYITMIVLDCFNLQYSKTEIYLEVSLILETLTKIASNRPLK